MQLRKHGRRGRAQLRLHGAGMYGMGVFGKGAPGLSVHCFGVHARECIRRRARRGHALCEHKGRGHPQGGLARHGACMTFIVSVRIVIAMTFKDSINC
jgi:hypothetical protein